MKLCSKCGETKEPSQFYVSKHRPDGLSSYCRECQIRDAKSRYSPHPRWRAPEGQKFCPRCSTTKPKEEFGKNRSQFDGLQSVCKPCAVAAVTASRHKDPTAHRRSSKAWKERNPERAADNNARWTYGIDRGTYTNLLDVQNGGCGICGTREIEAGRKRFSIDHCHETGEVVGLLCGRCNTGIGQLGHNVEILEKAIQYLKSHNRIATR